MSLLYILFLSFFLLSKPVIKDSEVKKISNPFENAVETKLKYWYDINDTTKTPLAAMSIVTKYETNHWFRKKIENVSKEYIEAWSMEFEVPLKLADGSLIFSTKQLAYYLE